MTKAASAIESVFDSAPAADTDHARNMNRSTWTIQLVNLLAVVVPFLGFIAAAVLLWGWGVDWVSLAILGAMYLMTSVGVTVGFHRLFTHRAYETNNVIKAILGIWGSMAVEGPVLRWVATHRRHHQHSDHDDDPHSPHLHGEGFGGMMRGLWHSHTGWLFDPEFPGLTRYVGDLRKDPLIRWIDATFVLWVVLSFVIPTVAGGLITMSWKGALLGFLWGGLARVFLVHHVTWSINSVCHLWGTQPFRGEDESRNNPVFGVIALGEGWHNNHHAFPSSARHGLRWWEFDASYWIIRGLEALGLAWKVKVPKPEQIAAKMHRRAERHAEKAAQQGQE